VGLIHFAIIHARAHLLAKCEKSMAVSLMAVAGDPQAAMQLGKSQLRQAQLLLLAAATMMGRTQHRRMENPPLALSVRNKLQG